MWQSILTIFYVVWLIAVLILLWLIWHSSENRLKHIEKMEQVQFDAAMVTAKAAQKAADTAYILAEKFKGAK